MTDHAAIAAEHYAADPARFEVAAPAPVEVPTVLDEVVLGLDALLGDTVDDFEFSALVDRVVSARMTPAAA